VALKQSPAYEKWLKQIATLQHTNAISCAIHFGWLLREAVESNWWDSLPRASDTAYSKALTQLADEILGPQK